MLGIWHLLPCLAKEDCVIHQEKIFGFWNKNQLICPTGKEVCRKMPTKRGDEELEKLCLSVETEARELRLRAEELNFKIPLKNPNKS